MKRLLFLLLAAWSISALAQQNNQPSPISSTQRAADEASQDVNVTGEAIDIIAKSIEAIAENTEPQNYADPREQDLDVTPLGVSILDLKAQRDMAAWAAFLFGATVVGIFISAATLIALIVTIKQTKLALAQAKRANDEAREAIRIELRAYIAVDAGTGTYQDANNNFASSPILKNTGNTPARNVRHRIKAAVLDFPPRADYSFDSSMAIVEADVMLPVGAAYTMTAIVPGRLDDEEVATAMLGVQKRLFTWGTIFYEDVFGNTWVTNFCHNHDFPIPKEGPVQHRGFYFLRHNSAT